MSNANDKSSQSSSPSNSISLIKLDELSSFGATKQNRLPTLIKLNTIDQNQPQQPQATNSLPDKVTEQNDNQQQQQQTTSSLPTVLTSENNKEKMPETMQTTENQSEKENLAQEPMVTLEATVVANDDSDDFQVVDMQQDESADTFVGPSLQMPSKDHQQISKEQIDKSINALQTSLQLGNSTHVGDSLIEMIINLRNENQNLIRALETNNEFVKQRLGEFKRIQEDSKKRETQSALEKADFEHQIRKLQRQNTVLSDRLKSMEAKLKDMKLEVSQSLNAAHSSKASSIQNNDNGDDGDNLYPIIDDFSIRNDALTAEGQATGDTLNQAVTMQVDATSGELYNQGDQQSNASIRLDSTTNQQQQSSTGEKGPKDFSAMSKEELSRHFDAKKVEFYALDDPMKQCDKLEQQLNDIGNRDYEVCLLQQQLNIYRQDFRLERMEKLEAQIQIEKLKNDIDRLCLERLQAGNYSADDAEPATMVPDPNEEGHYHGARKISDGLGRFGHHLTKKAARQAAKAAKYAAKQAHLEEKAAAALARVAAARAASTTGPTANVAPPQTATTMAGTQTAPSACNTTPKTTFDQQHHHHFSRHHHRHHSHGGGRPRGSGIRSEVVNDLFATANKAMLTGYKMASTHVNLALDKLSQYEQQQASQLEKNKQQQAAGGKNGEAPSTKTPAPSAPLEHPSID